MKNISNNQTHKSDDEDEFRETQPVYYVGMYSIGSTVSVPSKGM